MDERFTVMMDGKRQIMVENNVSTLVKVGSCAWNGKIELKHGFPSKT